MNRFEHKVALLIDLCDALSSRGAPCHVHHTTGPACGNKIDDPLGEPFPASVGMAVGIMSTHGQACVEQENTSISPRREQTSTVRRRNKVWVVDGEGLVHVLEGRRGDGGRPDGECKAVCLTVIVVWVLANNYDFDFVEGRVTRPMRVLSSGPSGMVGDNEVIPGVDIFPRREDLGASSHFAI